MEIKLLRENRKTISVKIANSNCVIVKAPKSMPTEKINKFIYSKASWINRHVNLLKMYECDLNDVISMKSVCIFGKIQPYFNNFKKYYENLATTYLSERVEVLSNKLNFTYKAVNLKNFTSKWGMCDNNGVITLNKKLVFLDCELIDYVIVHELCHTIYFNHKKDFHKLVSKFFDNEKVIKNKLKKYALLLKIKY